MQAEAAHLVLPRVEGPRSCREVEKKSVTRRRKSPPPCEGLAPLRRPGAMPLGGVARRARLHERRHRRHERRLEDRPGGLARARAAVFGERLAREAVDEQEVRAGRRGLRSDATHHVEKLRESAALSEALLAARCEKAREVRLPRARHLRLRQSARERLLSDLRVPAPGFSRLSGRFSRVREEPVARRSRVEEARAFERAPRGVTRDEEREGLRKNRRALCETRAAALEKDVRELVDENAVRRALCQETVELDAPAARMSEIRGHCGRVCERDRQRGPLDADAEPSLP